MSEAADKAWEKFNTRTAGMTRYEDRCNERDVFNSGFVAGGIHALEQAADEWTPPSWMYLAPRTVKVALMVERWLRSGAKQLREDSQ